MAVVTVSTTTVKPDRYEEYVEQVARKAKPIMEKHGAKLRTCDCWLAW